MSLRFTFRFRSTTLACGSRDSRAHRIGGALARRDRRPADPESRPLSGLINKTLTRADRIVVSSERIVPKIRKPSRHT